MEQIKSIDEVLAEFREKYKDSKVAGGEKAAPPEKDAAAAPAVPAPLVARNAVRSRRGEYGFLKIVAVQAAAVLAVFAALLTLRLLNPELFSRFAEYIRARMYL